MADPAYATTNRTSRAAEHQRQDGRDAPALSPELLTQSEPRKPYGTPCGAPVEGRPHLIVPRANKTFEGAEQRGAQKLDGAELSEVGTDAN